MKNMGKGRMSDQERKEIIELTKAIEQLNRQKLLLVQNATQVLLIQQEMEQAGKDVADLELEQKYKVDVVE